MHKHKIRGVNYMVSSFYSGDKLVFDRIGNLIMNSAESDKVPNFQSESLSGNGIDFEKP